MKRNKWVSETSSARVNNRGKVLIDLSYHKQGVLVL